MEITKHQRNAYLRMHCTLMSLFALLYIPQIIAQERKDWTVIVYMAADNDLRGFAARNIKQMAEIGSNKHFNIVVELHIRISGNQKITRRYYIEKNKIYHVNADDPSSQVMDSGDPQTLVSCCQWATTDYPANKYALVFWNHGTGVIDPGNGRIINPTELFTFNPAINKFELDRTVGFLDFIRHYDAIDRGICWDDSTGNYLNNQKLERALQEITSHYLNNQKFNLLCFDACLMAGLEIANIAKDYANYMIGSQEVELGTGYNYQKTLSIFQNSSPDEIGFARHIVKEYGNTYNSITNDYTQSAIALGKISRLEDNIDAIADTLLTCLAKQKNLSVQNVIRASRDKRACTHFDEPSYLDLHHLYKNLQANLTQIILTNKATEELLKTKLAHLLEQGCALIKEIAFANTCGKNLKNAQGISIYFPERRIHHSYLKTKFAAENKWIKFLNNYTSL